MNWISGRSAVFSKSHIIHAHKSPTRYPSRIGLASRMKFSNALYPKIRWEPQNDCRTFSHYRNPLRKITTSSVDSGLFVSEDDSTSRLLLTFHPLLLLSSLMPRTLRNSYSDFVRPLQTVQNGLRSKMMETLSHFTQKLKDVSISTSTAYVNLTRTYRAFTRS
jgi:hypothetical protein